MYFKGCRLPSLELSCFFGCLICCCCSVVSVSSSSSVYRISHKQSRNSTELLLAQLFCFLSCPFEGIRNPKEDFRPLVHLGLAHTHTHTIQLLVLILEIEVEIRSISICIFSLRKPLAAILLTARVNKSCQQSDQI